MIDINRLNLLKILKVKRLVYKKADYPPVKMKNNYKVRNRLINKKEIR